MPLAIFDTLYKSQDLYPILGEIQIGVVSETL